MMMKDERIKQAHDQIMAEFGTAVFFFALAAFLVKILLLHRGLSDCVVEYVIMIGAPLFQAVRCRQMKIAFYRPGMEKTYWKKALAVLAAVAVVYIAYSWASLGGPAKKLLPLAAFAAAFAAIRFGPILLEKKRAKKLEKEFEDE